MVPIISIVGRSKSGKTTLIERLLPELIRRGYRVATIKHTHEPFEIDCAGKDSQRHKEAGAHTVIISSPYKVALIEDAPQDLSLDELAVRFVREADIIIAEGFKGDKHPKVEVFRRAVHSHPLASELENMIAIMSDESLQMDIPCLDVNDTNGAADIIEEHVIATQGKGDTTLVVNGKAIPLAAFAKSIISARIQGMLSSLKGCENPKEIEIRIQVGEEK
jgi:molybdopterin-guanine dinucleotide biosynthesis protein B